MKFIAKLLSVVLVSASFSSVAQEEVTSSGYIIDDLFIFMHAGPGNQFRIIGSITAGSEIKITENIEDNFTQIRDSKNRLAWVESKYVTSATGIRQRVAGFDDELSARDLSIDNLRAELETANNELLAAQSESDKIKEQLSVLNRQLMEKEAKLSTQDLDVKKQWFINGAIVLGSGLLLGLIIPKLFSGRRKSSSWK